MTPRCKGRTQANCVRVAGIIPADRLNQFNWNHRIRPIRQGVTGIHVDRLIRQRERNGLTRKSTDRFP